MIINEHTKILEIIKSNEQAIEIIAQINSNFKKLKNPVLRKLLAPRVNVKQAAKIGGVSSDSILEALSKIGFQIENCQPKETINIPELEKQINMNHLEKITLDVRPILNSGEDPFNKIMAQLKTMNEHQALLIINTFEPIPLLNILKDKGFSYQTTRPTEQEVHTLLYKTSEEKLEEPKNEKPNKDWSFEHVEEAYKGKMAELDVRDLEMPMPMVSILEAVENIDSKNALFVHHKKLPQYLIPELKNRDFSFVSKEIDSANIKLIIFKS
ncbi:MULTISPECIES: DUF2249 domain-containing protein [unclassified Lentimicrobium]|uniref:DUF2249 domain-containing protein n=1 Tax=unclassified Lentimicrobium TaxID=2677434 RepID=UPI0015569148|nr:MULTISPECIES: DUF2249 domain-containing protein [unclassified Lentimicrobium]NPD44380.1 DUF2249 domain-containing protein [Lentimicrobium sp. S6]NPD86174.1 DUF2249 domain-containing protein [Lentimicrobium sp. L6]